MPESPEIQNAVLYKAADRSTRRYGVRAGMFLVVAVAMALGSALLLTRYMDKRTQAAAVPTAFVMVAAMDLPVGTELHAEQLHAIAWPAASLPEGYFTSMEELDGKMTAVRVYKGEALLPALLVGSEAGKGLSALLPAGFRAAAVRVDDIVGVAGFIHPGDSVDVVAVMRTEGSQNLTESRVILQAIKVLAVGKDLDAQSKSGEKVVPATVATLLVNTAQSERLALASSQGKLLLTLRGSTDSEFVETKGVNPNTMLVTAEPPSPPVPAKPETRVRLARAKAVETVTTSAITPQPKGEVVEILRGDLFERRDFQKEGKP